ncbi:MAG: hypothetical protein HPZ91_18035 [Lentisphaeria bacterium]|nr:hypothetical protein [Lentisphaeria bacterium]
MKKHLLILILVIAGTGFFAVPEAKAMDPVTIAILAPAAMRMAEATHPYIMQGIGCAARGMAKAGLAGFRILYLPWGVVQCTLGLPLGGLGPGIGNIVEGGTAPFELGFRLIMLPVNFCGVDI